MLKYDKEIQKNRFTQFDEDIVNTFINIIVENKAEKIIKEKAMYK